MRQVAPVCAAAAVLLAGCSPKTNPATKQYLQQYMAVVSNFDASVSAIKMPAHPDSFPDVSKMSDVEQAEALKKYGGDLLPYYAAINTLAGEVIAACNTVQRKGNALSTSGVDATATDLTEQFGALANRRLQLALDLQALAGLWREQFDKGGLPRISIKVLDVGLAGVLTPTGAAGGVKSMELTKKQESEATPQDVDVLRALDAWKKAAAAVSAACKDTAASLKASYPGEDWSFLAAGK